MHKFFNAITRIRKLLMQPKQLFYDYSQGDLIANSFVPQIFSTIYVVDKNSSIIGC